MANETINIGFRIESDFSELQQGLSALRTHADALDGSLGDVKETVGEMNEAFSSEGGLSPTLFSQMPEQLQTSYHGMFRAAQEEVKRLNEALGSGNISAEMTNAVRQSVGFLAANLRTLTTSANQLGGIFSGISYGMKDDFAASVSDMVRNASMILRGSKVLTAGMSDRHLATQLQKDQGFAAGMQAVETKFRQQPTQTAALLEGVVKHSVPAMYRDEYWRDARRASSGVIKREDIVPDLDDFRKRLPSRYHGLPLDPRRPDAIRTIAQDLNGTLSSEEYRLVREVAAQNPTFERALTTIGLAERKATGKHAGILHMPKEPITKAQYAQALGVMYRDELIPALEGAPAYFRNISSMSGYDQLRLASKNSRVPSDVYSAAKQLDIIDVSPTFASAPIVPKGKMVRVDSGSLSRISHDVYQIPSLTLTDFQAGVLPEIKGRSKMGFDTTRYDEGSMYKFLNRSAFTDLLGLHGHNTFGDGSKTDASKPRMMVINMGDRLLETDSEGRLVFENGRPVQNRETAAALTRMFERTETLRYQRNGVEEEYRYPVVEHGEGDRKVRYVPTTIKGTNVILGREDAFREGALPFLQKYGVNVFDNLMSQDTEFSTLEGMTKRTEARNRLLTPSVPMAELGGKMPAKNRIAFVDASSFSGLDGAMMFMPGFIPGGDATLRAPGIKGVGQSVDFHKMIHDLYGDDVTEFFLPAINAPEDLKRRYKTEGINAIRSSITPADFTKYFIDIMQHDALITDSVVKSDFFRETGLSNSELQDRLMDTLQLSGAGGFRVYKTAREFWTDDKHSLSAQFAQNLDLTEEDVQRNNAQWEQHIQDLRDPQKAIRLLFSDDNDPVSIRVRANPGLLQQDREAQERVENAIRSAYISQQRGEMYGRGQLAMGVAQANPAEWISAAATANGLKVAPGSENLFSALSLSAPEGASPMIAAARWKSTAMLGGGRFPQNQMEQFTLENSKKYITLLEKYGMNPDGVYMNAETIRKMGGGDFDGDTVQLVRGKLEEVIARTLQLRTQQLGKYTPQRSDLSEDIQDWTTRSLLPSDMADMLYRNAVSTYKMSRISTASDALAQGNWHDPHWVDRYGKAGIDLKMMYDIDTTFAKTGVAAKWTKYAKDAGRDLGIPFAHAFKDLAGAIDNNDMSLLGDLSRVNFPSRYNALTVSSLSALYKSPMVNEFVEELVTRQRKLQGIDALLNSNSPLLQAQGAYLDKNLLVMADMLTGRGAGVSREDQGELTVQLETWAKLAKVEKGVRAKEEDTPERKQLISAIQTQRNRLQFLSAFGLTQDSVEKNFGYVGVAGFGDAPYFTGQRSSFQAGLDAETSRIRSQAAIISAALPETTDAIRAVAAAQQTSNARRIFNGENVRDNKGLVFSYTMLSDLKNDPKSWYDRYIAGGPKPAESAQTIIGLAAHEATEAYLNRRIANNADRGTPEEFERIFTEYLLGTTMFAGDASLLQDKMKLNNVQSRYQNALQYVRGLPQLLADEEILAAESAVAPDMGFAIDPVTGAVMDKPVRSYGKIDIVSRRRNQDGSSVLIYSDLKPSLTDRGEIRQSALEQLMLYSTSKALPGQRHFGTPDALRVIAYGSSSAQQKEVPFDAEKAKAVTQEYQALVTQVAAFANAGFPVDYLNQFFPWGTQTGANATIPSAWRAARNAGIPMYPASGNFVPNTPPPANPPTPPSPPVPLHEPPDPNSWENLAQKELANAAVEKTGRGIALGFALQQEQLDYSSEFTKMSGEFSSIERRAEDGPSTFGRWQKYSWQLNEGYEKHRDTLAAKGASDADLILLDADRNAAKAKYRDALRVSSYADLEKFSKELEDQDVYDGADSGVVKLIKQFEALDESITRARSAYTQLQQELAEKQREGETITDEEIASLTRAQEADEAAQRLKDERQSTLAEHSKLKLEQEFEDLDMQQTGGQLSAEKQIERAVVAYKEQINQQKNNIYALYEKGIITEDEYADYGTRLGRYESEEGIAKYKQRLEQQAQLRQESEALQREDTVRNLQERGRNIARQAGGVRRNDPISRIVYEQQDTLEMYRDQVSAVKQAMQQRASQLASEGVSKDKYGEDKDYSKLQEELAAAENGVKQFEGSAGMARTAVLQIGEAVTNVAGQFARQLFHQAIQEAKRFVMEFDKAMTEIQMVTMKTNQEIDGLGKNLIGTAMEMKVSISDVTDAATELYRQGQSDEEVAIRMEDVIKFSTVANISTTDANKILTTAMTNGLATDTGHVMDALVALGDAAATSAAEISKGMQKSAASTVQAGVSLEELFTMLTIITSRTQLGGNQAGTALQTLMYRLYRVADGDDYYDENGNRVGSNEATRALKQLGVSVYNDDGSQRGVFEIMMDVAKNWNAADTVSQEMVLNSLGAGRQRSNIATLIQGLAEDDGALAEKYMGLAEGSDGITDEKHVAYLESMTAAVTNLTNAFDKLIETMDLDEVGTVLLDMLTSLINAFAWANEHIGLFNGVLASLAVLLAGAAAKAQLHAAATWKQTAAVAALQAVSGKLWVLPVVAAVAGLATMATTGIANAHQREAAKASQQQAQAAQTQAQTTNQKQEAQYNIDEAYNTYQTNKRKLDRINLLFNKYHTQGLTEYEINDFSKLLNELCKHTGNAAAALDSTGGNLENTASQIHKLNQDIEAEVNREAQKSIQAAKDEAQAQAALMHMDPQSGVADFSENPLSFHDARIQREVIDMAQDPDTEKEKWRQMQGTWFTNPYIADGKALPTDITNMNQQSRKLFSQALIAETWWAQVSSSSEFNERLEQQGFTLDNVTAQDVWALAFMRYEDLTSSQSTELSDAQRSKFSTSYPSKQSTVYAEDVKLARDLVEALYGSSPPAASADWTKEAGYSILSSILPDMMPEFVDRDHQEIDAIARQGADLIFQFADNWYANGHYPLSRFNDDILLAISVIEDSLYGANGELDYSGTYDRMLQHPYLAPYQVVDASGSVVNTLNSQNEVIPATHLSYENALQVQNQAPQEIVGYTTENDNTPIYQQTLWRIEVMPEYMATSSNGVGERQLDTAVSQNDESNRSAMRAEELFEQLSFHIDSFPDSQPTLDNIFNDIIGFNQIDAIIQDMPELGVLLDQYIQRDNYGNRVVESGRFVFRELSDEDSNMAINQVLNTIARHTRSYSTTPSWSNATRASYASMLMRDALNGVTLRENDIEYQQGAIGDSLAAKLLNAGSKMIDETVDSGYLDENGYINSSEIDSLPDSLRNFMSYADESSIDPTADNYASWARAYNLTKRQRQLSSIEADYINTLLNNMRYGISGLTRRQLVAGAKEMLQHVDNGTLDQYMQNDASVVQAYSTAYDSLPTYSSVAHIIETAGILKENGSKYLIRDLAGLDKDTEAYNQINAALIQMGYSASEAVKVMKNLDEEIFIDGIAAWNAYGDATAEVTEQMQKWAGSTREVANATRDLITAMTQASNNQYYRQQYIGGDRSVETLQAIGQMTGLPVEFLLNNSETVAGLFPIFQASDLEGVQNMYSSFDIYLNDADLRTALGMDTYDFETGDFDLATAASSLDSSNTAYKDFKAIVAWLALLNGGTLTVSQNEIPIAVTSGTTTGATANGTNSESAASTTYSTDETAEADIPAETSTLATEAATTTTEIAYTINSPGSIPIVTRSDYDTALDGMLLTDYGFGAGSMTPAGRIAIANNMLEIIDDRLMGDFTRKANQNTRSIYGSTFQNMPMVMELAEQVSGVKDSEGNEYDLYDLRYLSPDDEGYQVLDERLRQADSSAEHALSAMEALAQEMAVAGVQASTIYGDTVEDVASHFAEQTGSIKSATLAYQQFLSIVGQADKESSLYAMWQGGNRTIDVATQLANLYGIEVDDLYTDSSAVARGHSRFVATNQYDVQTWVDAYGAAALSHTSEGFNDQFTASDWWPSNFSSDELWIMSLPEFTQYAIDIEGEEFAGKDILAELAAISPNTTVSISSGGDIRFHSNHQDNQAWVEAQGNAGTMHELEELVNSTMPLGESSRNLSITDLVIMAESIEDYHGGALNELKLIKENAPHTYATVNEDGTLQFHYQDAPSGDQSPLDQWVSSSSSYAEQYGMTGMTSLNKYRLAQLMRSSAESGTFANLYTSSNSLTRQALMESTANAGMYGYMALGLGKYNDLTGKELNIADLSTMTTVTEGYAEMKAAIEAMGLSFPEAQKYAQDFIQETEDGILSLMKVFDDLTDEILEGSKAWAGTDRDRFGAAKEMTSAIDTAAENSWYRDIYLNAADKSQLPGYVLDYIANITDFDRTTIENDPSGIVTSMLQYSQLADKEGMTVQATELSQYLPVGGDLLNYLMPNAVANVLTPTPELIAGLGNINAPGASEWQMLLGQLYSAGGTVKITPKTYKEEVVGDDGRPTGEKVIKTTYEITIDGVKRGLTEADADYAIDSEDVYGFGISKAEAPNWKLDTADTLLGNIADKDLTDWLSGKSPDTIRALSSVIEGLPEQAHMAAIVEEGTGRHYSIFDLDTADAQGRSEIEAALTAEGYSVATARKAIADVNNSFYYEGIRTANAYGNATEDVINVMAQLSGSAEEAASAFQNLFSSMYKLSDMKTLQMLWNSGSRSDFVVSGIASMTGMSERDVRNANNASLVSDKIAAEIGAAEEGYGNQLSGWDQYLTPVLMHELGIGVGGSKTMSKLIPRLTELANGGNENAQALLDLYSAASLDGGSLTVTGVEQLHLTSTKASSTPLYMTDANGNMIPVTRRPIAGASGQISYTALDAAISEADQWYSDLTGSANGKAITSMTDLQKHRGAQRLWQEVSGGGFVNFYDGASDEIQKEIVGLTGTSGMYAYTAYGLEKAGFNANDLLTVKEGTAEYAEMETAVAALNLTMAEAQEYVRAFAEESQDGILELDNVWGDFTASVIEGSTAWKGSISQVVAAIKNMNSTVSEAASLQEARERYLNGDTSPETYQAIANETGYAYDYVARDPHGYVHRMMSTFENGSLAQIDGELNALGKAMVDENNMPKLLSWILNAGGPINLQALSTQMSIMPGEQTQQMGALFSQADYFGGEISVSPYVDETSGKTYYRFSATGLETPKTAWDRQYIDYSTDPFGLGITNFTSLRKLGAAQQMISIMSSGDMLQWLAGNRQSTVQGYSSVLGSMPQVMQLAAILERGYRGSHSLMDLAEQKEADPDAYAEMDRVLREAGYSAEFAIDAVESLNNEALYEGIRATNTYGDATEEVISLMQQMEDGANGAAQAFMSLASAMQQVSNIEHMMAQYGAGSRDPQQVADIKSVTGLTEKEIYQDSELTLSALRLQEAKSKEDLATQAAAYDAIVTKLNLAPRDTPYSMAEVMNMAQASINANDGRISESEYHQLQLWNSYSSRYGYIPTYSATAGQTIGMPETPTSSPRMSPMALFDGSVSIWDIVSGWLNLRDETEDGVESPATVKGSLSTTSESEDSTLPTYAEGSADAWYTSAWNDYRQMGLTEMTDAQKLVGMNMLSDWAAAGTLTTNLNAIELNATRQALLGISPTSAAFMHWGQLVEEKAAYTAEDGSTPYAGLNYANILGITGDDENYGNWVSMFGSEAAFLAAQEAAEAYYDECEDGALRAEKVYGDFTDEVLDGSKRWKGSARDVAAAYKDLNSTLSQVANNQYYRQQYKAGKRDDETIDAIASMTGFDSDFVREHEDVVNETQDAMMADDAAAVQNQLSQFDQFLNLDDIVMQLPDVKAAGGSVDFAAAVSQMQGESAEQLQWLASMLQAMGFTASIVEEQLDNNTVHYRIQLDDMSGLAGRKPSGGGGGGGKSAVDKLLEEQEREQKLWEHRRKMIQYEETRYQNAGELSNYAIMLSHEADEIQRQIGLREKQIEQLKEQMRKTEEYSDDWYTLRDAIMSGEEALAELINDAEDLDRTLEEVQQQILKLHTDLEGEVLQEIEARIQKERDMLDGTVQMQEIILEAIRERYRKEWELMQEDLNKKREALEEEIAMIDERLQRRKDAEDEAAKYEELAELQRQLALISMDSTRTKDQAELREKIAEIEDELSWDSAEDEAERQKEDLQDQVDAYNDYETEYQEWLDEYLEDANNFAEEVNKVMAMNQEELLAWLSENVEAFSLSLDEAQKQMLQGWTDTFKQMHGIVDTYWEEIAKTLSSKESFLEYMMQSDSYVNASEDEQKQMLWNWGKMYDDWIAAKKIGEEAQNWDHQDEGYTGVAEGDVVNPNSDIYRWYYSGYNAQGVWTQGGYGQGATSEIARMAAERQAAGKPLTGVRYAEGGYPNELLGSSSVSAIASGKPGTSDPVIKRYATGGLVDYTGIAYVDGTLSKPEAFLSADDTALVRSMLDAWQLVMARPTMSNLDGIIGKGQQNSIGDVHITITEASFAEDADYEEVARRVGAAFTKELAMQGFRTASFNF